MLTDLLALVGVVCIAAFALCSGLVLFFVLAPSRIISELVTRASGGVTESSDAWRRCIATLLLALAIDGVGNLTFALPGVGEAADIAWAPVSAYLVTQIPRPSTE